MPRSRAPQPPIHLRSARLLDVDKGEYLEPGELLIDGDRIVEVQPPSVPAGAAVVDLGDLTLLPGLMDMEVNLLLGGPDHTSPLQAVRARLDSNPDLISHGPGAVLYAILDQVVDDYEPVVEGVDADIQQIEEQVFSDDRHLNPAQRIYRLESEVLDFDRAVAPLATAVDRLARRDFAVIDKELRQYIRDVHDHLLRVVPQVHGFRELLTTALLANLTQTSVRQNEDMRRISAWVAMLAVPTAVAGIYGMNFEHMPELKSELGYPAVLLFILIVCVLLHRRFKRAGWL